MLGLRARAGVPSDDNNLRALTGRLFHTAFAGGSPAFVAIKENAVSFGVLSALKK